MTGLFAPPIIGTHATVFVHQEGGEPNCISQDSGLRREICDLAGPTEDFDIVSVYALHIAIYALQNPTPANIDKALFLIGTSGDCEEAVDTDTFRPLPMPPPNGWDGAHVPLLPADDEAMS